MFCRGLFHRFTLFNIVYIVYIILHCFTLLYIVLHCFLLFTLIYIVLHCGSLQLYSADTFFIVFHCFTLFYIVYIVYIVYIDVHCSTLFTLSFIVLHCGSLQLCSVEARKEESNTGLGETEMQYKNNINANTKITQIQIQNATLFGTEIQYRKEIKN